MTLIQREDQGRPCLFAAADGLVTIPELQSVLAIDRGEGGYACPELIDIRLAASDFAALEVRGLASWLAGFVLGHALGPTAIVVSTPVAYGMMRMLEALADGVCCIRPFRDRDEALRWLREAVPA
jgi:hypothetical protein